MSSNVVAVSGSQKQMETIEQVLIMGDLAKLQPSERLFYYKNVCSSLGLNPLTKPFDYITLNGKLTLYARKDATDQLRQLKRISITISSRELIEDVYVVTARAKDASGREDESTGAVPMGGLKGDARANAMMKAETKAKRRVTLSICGLGLLDETEVESIPDATKPNAAPGIFPEQPKDGDGFEPVGQGYRITFGKYAKRSLDEVPVDQLRDYVNYLERKIEEKGEKPSATVAEFIELAAAHIAALENAPLEVEE